jgi:hypothetical protein
VVMVTNMRVVNVEVVKEIMTMMMTMTMTVMKMRMTTKSL